MSAIRDTIVIKAVVRDIFRGVINTCAVLDIVACIFRNVGSNAVVLEAVVTSAPQVRAGSSKQQLAQCTIWPVTQRSEPLLPMTSERCITGNIHGHASQLKCKLNTCASWPLK